MTNTAETYTSEIPNLDALNDRLDLLPPTRQADFQSYLLGAAAAVIDTETWNDILNRAHAYARQDPWA